MNKRKRKSRVRSMEEISPVDKRDNAPVTRLKPGIAGHRCGGGKRIVRIRTKIHKEE